MTTNHNLQLTDEELSFVYGLGGVILLPQTTDIYIRLTANCFQNGLFRRKLVEKPVIRNYVIKIPVLAYFSNFPMF